MKRYFGIAFGCVLVAGACGGGGGDTQADASNDPDASQEPVIDALPFNPCKRVDILFAVDGSFTMQEEAAALANDVFPGFAQRLREVGQGVEDYHVGIIDACPAPATLHTRGKTIEDCAFSSGQPWMKSDSPSLNTEFGCVADLYTDDFGPDIPGTCTKDNDDEQPANAAATALLPPFVDNENAGFMRDDALLVIVAMTDEDETAIPPGGDPIDDRLTPDQIYDKLISIKGNPERIVFLGIGGLPDADGDTIACTADQGMYGEAKESARLKAVADKFAAEDRGLFWDLCTGRLEDGLEQAMLVIESTCNIVN